MNTEDILRMAKEARFYIKDDEAYSPSNQEDHELTEHLERFAKLVAEHEREACAKVCDVLAYHPEFASDVTKLAAMAIRARKQA
jgi:DNA-directed RNA polymerase subunit F